MNLKKTTLLAALISASGMNAALYAQSEQVLFFENFDDMPLGANIEEGIETGEGGPMANVWTPDFPAGWTEDFNLPGIGVLEWQGWNLVDGQWWAFTCGDQDRTNFVEPSENGLSRGVVAIADGDEWDDYDANDLVPEDEGLMQALMTTPAFDITDVAAGSVGLSFFSSWRDEDLQTAVVEVSYDGGAFEEVLRWSSDSEDPNFHDDNANEIVELSIDNPEGMNSMQVRFSYLDGGNDWWWGIDSIQVVGQRTGAEVLAPGYSFVEAETFNMAARPTISIGDAAGATSYSVVVAKDAEFQDVRSMSSATTAGDYILPVIPSGIYYLKTVAENVVGSRDSENVIRIVIDNPIIADLDGSGSLNFFDISTYLQLFSAGCP